MPPARRPGGRTARVRAQVHEAVLDLLKEEAWDNLSIPLVAERSGVHQATIYRRWGSLSALVDDIVTGRLTAGSPVPDTGTLRGDLEAYAVKVAEDVASPMGMLYVRAAMVGSKGPEGETYLLQRAVQLNAMLERAAARGERPPDLLELMEVVIAPLYYHLIFFNRPVGAEHARMLVDRLLRLAPSPPASGPAAPES
ncbi:TetR family transcriptional regulator [Nonomuraea phyllanthi]|uniref:TetR family transcriptional regulator n=1 Tax=Nonomuraea phyllanthi TaxID=2219224 RepID=A0A5C4V8U2_9ACTN|nr:TetR/AcrR family transcriptional regulator [Nonomuraea phyllanthi]KAB8187533.1 TetR family transcriptional regulator [Nonomuraea phyllanthi]QFY07036.1 TetR family transcriptional regulator [Nonomuraea phyllanthi]